MINNNLLIFYTIESILELPILSYNFSNIYILPYFLNYHKLIDNNIYNKWCGELHYNYNLPIILEKLYNASIYYEKINEYPLYNYNLAHIIQFFNRIIYLLPEKYSTIIQIDNNIYLLYKINLNYIILIDPINQKLYYNNDIINYIKDENLSYLYYLKCVKSQPIEPIEPSAPPNPLEIIHPKEFLKSGEMLIPEKLNNKNK